MLEAKHIERYHALAERLKTFSGEGLKSPWYKKTYDEWKTLDDWVQFFENRERFDKNGTLGAIVRRIQLQLYGRSRYPNIPMNFGSYFN